MNAFIGGKYLMNFYLTGLENISGRNGIFGAVENVKCAALAFLFDFTLFNFVVFLFFFVFLFHLIWPSK